MMPTARSVAKNTSFLLLGRVIAMGLGVFYFAALARYIHDTGLGKIATAMSIVSLLTLLMNFGLSQVIIRDVANDKARARSYVSNALFLRGVLSAVSIIALVIVTKITGYPADTILIIYIYAAAYIFDEITDVTFSIFSAFEKMEHITALQVFRDIINIVLSLWAIYLHASLITIVSISALASLVKLFGAWIVLRWKFIKPVFHLDLRLCRELIIAALPFAAMIALQAIHRKIDTIILSLNRPPSEVGWFSAGNTIIDYLLLLPSVFLQAIFPVFSRLYNSSKTSLQLAYSTSFKYLLLLGIPLCIGTLVSADKVITLVFGSGFEKAAVSLKISSFLLFWMFGFANGGLLNATGGQKLLAVYAAFAAFTNLLLALFLVPRYGYLGASVASVVPGMITFFPITLICHKKVSIGLPYAMMAKILISALCMGGATHFALKGDVSLFIAVFLIAPMVYMLCLLALHAIEKKDLDLFIGLVKGKGR